MAAVGNIPFQSQSVYGRNEKPDYSQTTGGVEGTNKLWLPIWSGEVIRAYDQYRIFEPMVESRTISSGVQMEFPITGTAGLKTAWGAGEELVGNVDNHVSKTIAVQLDSRPIASHFEIDNIDLMNSQWEFRSELARQVGQTLANARDLQVGAFLVRAGCESLLAADPRLAAAATGSKWRNNLQESPLFHPGGTSGRVFGKADLDDLGKSSSSAAERAKGALALLECIEEFQVHLQEIGGETSGVFCAVNPQAFQDIRALGVARTVSELAGGAGRPMFGGVAEAGGLGEGLRNGMMALTDTLEYMGCTIVKTNHMPDFDARTTIPTDGTAGNGPNQIGEARYNLNFSGTADATTASIAGIDVGAIIWQQGAVASIQKSGLKVDTVDDVRRNTVFTVASMLSGTGVLKPEVASVVCRKDLTTDTRASARTRLGMTAEYGTLVANN
jgi:hypothetical protein